MAQRTVDLLPEIFRTDTNKKFFAATLDQLTQEPRLKKTQGFVGRRVGPGVNPADNYVTEPSKTRSDYQLEPGVVFLKTDTNTAIDAITYPGMIDALDMQGANTQRQDRLWQSEYYAWDPFCDLDKFTNYSQYYWLPAGPDSVDLSSTAVPLTDDFTVTRISTLDTHAYQFSGIAGDNPIVTLARGGTYTFEINQPGAPFWIQSVPGINGTLPQTPNISSRDVLGVTNNGTSGGTITFNVPLKNAQDFYYNLTDFGSVDLLTSLPFDQINNIYVDDFLAANPSGIDGVTNLNGRTVVFTTQTTGWEVTTFFDPLLPAGNVISGPGSYDSLPYDLATPITDQAIQYSVWQIQYIYDFDNRPYMVLTSVLPIPNLNKFRISFGTQWSNTQWYKNSGGYFEQVPLLTAILDSLWYQDGSDPDIFGQIRLVDPDIGAPVDANDIVGAKNYTSPNGVILTNGMKVQFRGLTRPAEFQNLEYYVEGVGTGPGIGLRVGFIDGKAYFGPWHYYQGLKMTGSVHSEETFQLYIYESIENSLLNPGAGAPIGAPLPITPIAGATLGAGIRLLPVTDFVTPETYTKNLTVPFDSVPFDSTAFDGSLNSPVVQDYLTINRASLDLNAWTRSNRWFHIDVLRVTAEYNNQTVVVDNAQRAKRPIIEFRASLELYNFGTQGKQPINVIDLQETDAFSNINGTLGYSIDGYSFITGTRVIFAADLDPQVRNRIWEVVFIDPNNSGNLVIDLVPVYDNIAQTSQTVVCLSGLSLQGKSFWFDGVVWVEAQQKTGVNQAPLFNIRDTNSVSYADRAVYPSSTFTGSRLFGYALGGTQQTDEVLGFALKYLNINNVGDIVFENYLYTDTFIYVRDSVSTTLNISNGYARQYVDRIQFSNLIGWQVAAAENRSRQVFRFIYDGTPLVFDVPPAANTVFPVLQIFIEGIFVDPSTYTLTNTSTSTTVTFVTAPPVGVIIDAELISDVASSVAYYEVPLNLENNPLNNNSTAFTLGTIRTHYNSIGQNLVNISGPINGANNTRDLGDIIRYGDLIVQNSAPLTLDGVFLRQQQYQLFNSIRFNSQEYEKYKALLIDVATRGDFVNNTPTQVLDQAMLEISLGRNNLSPFYWSDMVPSGETYVENTYTYTPISTPTFDTQYVYDFTTSNFRGLLVYLNGTLLIKDYDYTVGDNAPTVTITATLAVGDVIVIREYLTTYGSFVPNTPTKMGLYPAFKPEIFEDKTSGSPVLVIQGHDGSITRAFGDFRDNVLLEFESRIFDNLKIATPIPLTLDEVMPGQFRTTDYTLGEVNNILATDFLSWVGWNKLDYTTQNYLPGNEFTYNYSQSGNRLTAQPLLGAWRGIYNYFYDTYAPNTRPWEMLGFSQEPTWWKDEYGPAPYTSGNLVLWSDLEQGLVRDPAGSYVLPLYVRPGLTNVIPSDSEGALLSPLDAVVGNYDATSFRRSWAFGDDGPVESTWRTSSSWPFAVMRLLALTKPAKFFALFADRDRYVYDTTIEQYLWDDRYRLDANKLNPLYGQGVSKASYINWIIDYNRQLGHDSTAELTTTLNNVDVRLCWRLAAFSDKKYLKIYTERGTPNSLNTSLLLPDESYQLLLYKNQPFAKTTYSSVIIQKTDTGYAVLGYNTTNPYFEILTSRPSGNSITISAGNASVRVSTEYSNDVVQVPYGYVFTNNTAVCDFLINYGRLLEAQGMTFDSDENGYVLNWFQMAQEFLYWSQQGWASGSMVNLNPTATKLTVSRPQAVVDSIATPTPENLVLNQNRQVLPANDMVIDRLDNTFTLRTVTSNTINYIDLKYTSYEHIIILDNVSIFADLIYDPVTGARQSRVLVSGWLTADWTGLVDAPGFVLNQDNIVEWVPTRKYAKGEIVLFKNEYWSASTIIQPSQEFNYNVWIKSDYNQIQKGLLPNAANVSDQLAQAYSVYDANLETEIDLFSYGLIGFRPREYMAALNLDDVSQVDLYQQFIGTKGTVRSAEIFTFADLGKETAQYDIYEYWAMSRSQYGATANRRYFELLLNEANLKSDPSLIQVIEPGQTSQADQTVLLQNIWKLSYSPTSANLLPTTTSVVTDIGLPTAGYVKLDDVDITAFDLATSQAINNDLENVGVGTLIWVAKVNSYDWDVYRCEHIYGDITTVSDNLDNLSLVTFSRQHGLVTGDYLIIRFFNDAINGVYQIRSVPSLTTVLIDYVFTGSLANSTAVTGSGLGFILQPARVAQASDIATLPYVNEIVPGSKVWVDNNGDGLWTVLEKTSPFTPTIRLTANAPTANDQFGSAVAQGIRNLFALVGAPGYDSNAGGVYTYVKASNNQYVQNAQVQQLGTPDAVGFGNAMDIGDQSWAIVGASASDNNQGYAATIYNIPGTNVVEQTQLFVIPDQDFHTARFGHSVTISQNERWMYIGAPDLNKVYAYGLISVEEQIVRYVTDGNSTVYSFLGEIEIDNDQQVSVILDNTVLTLNVDYSVAGPAIALAAIPPSGLNLTILRRDSIQLDANNYTAVSGTTGGSGVDATFSVNNTHGVYSVVLINGGDFYAVNDTITILGTSVGGTTTANDIVITVTAIDGVGTGPITSITYAGTGAISYGPFALNDELYTATNIFSFAIKVNGSLYRPFIDYDIVADSTLATIEFHNAATLPPAGANITAYATSYWDFVEVLSVAGLSADAEFGHSVSTTSDGRQILVGAPGVTTTINSASAARAGSVYVFDRSVQTFQVTNAATLSYTTEVSQQGPVSVSINGEFLQDSAQFINGQYSIAGDTVTLASSVDLVVGDFVTVDTNDFTLIQQLTVSEPNKGSEFGYIVDQCINNCSLYVGAPFDNAILPKAGRVEYYQNQIRVYGTVTSNIGNPTLTPGEFIRINNIFVEVQAPIAWSTTVAWPINSFVTTSGNIYRALRNVPIGTAITDISYWKGSSWTEMFATQINNAGVPNAQASSVPDFEGFADGTSTVYSVGTIYSSADSYTPLVYVDNVAQTPGVNYTYNNSAQTITFATAPAKNVLITAISGRLTVSVRNFDASQPLDRLQVLPGTGTVFEDLGFETYVNQQVIRAPVVQDFANFGHALFISDNTTTLLVGAPHGSTLIYDAFDRGTTTFDANSTVFFNAVTDSGAVYTYDFLPAANATVNNPGQFAFGQQIYDSSIATGSEFGSAVDYTTGTLLIGAPSADLNVNVDSNYGQVARFENVDQLPAWSVLRLQQPVVDESLLNTAFMYDRVTNAEKQYFDHFNPLQGRILGIVRQNIDFIGAVDPAAYNVGELNNYGQRWAQARVGQIWWDTDNVRFIDPNQDDIVYASRRWGQVFPGSTVDVYQWISSTVPPVDYTGPGIPLSTTSYSVTSSVTEQGLFVTNYFFWVQGITTVARSAQKTLSTVTISQYIESPRSSGIAYIAPINSSTIAIYNGLPYISAQDTVLHVEFDQQFTENAVHVEYQLIAQDRADGFLSAPLYRKMQDSFSGVDTQGSPVPDPFLSPSEKYGVLFRPRQSFFQNRFLALENYLGRANTVLTLYPVTESRKFNLLNSAEPEPSASSGAWNKRVANQEELLFQDLAQVPVGYLYLVVSDSTNNGLWTIYQVVSGLLVGSKELQLSRVQNYDTKKYWSYVNWYLPGYNPLTRPVAEVPTYSALETITVSEGSSVRVTANAQGKFEIYQLTAGDWIRVGLEDGTIQFSAVLWDYALGRFGFDVEVFDAQYFDQEPVIETRKIIQAINEELFIDNLAIERNRLLTLMFNYILTEQQAPLWLTKTSLIDVDHTIRELVPFQIYRRDNQDFVLNYIQEVKPYHVQIREFNLIYNGFDQFLGSLTDFDLPAFWDPTQNLFISPVLDNTGTLSTTSSFPSSAAVWQTFPWNQWYQNYLLEIQDVTIVDNGTGYTIAPDVVVTGNCVVPAEMTAKINSAGQVIAIDITNPGQGYTTTAIITMTGGNGSGATAVAVMGNGLVRNINTTIKYDRYQYQTTIVDWEANVQYENGTQVRYDDRVWEASNDDSSAVESATFDPAQWTLVAASSLSGVDRTMGFYAPAVNEPGLDLALLISGVDYPGVQVLGPGFDQNTGFDVGNFDINPFDNISYGPEGRPTYDPAILDAIYKSNFVDPYLGVGPSAINVAGGAFVDEYSSHAPEELVPGAIFDTLDIRVFTTPGSDWTNNGHGFPLREISYEFTVPGTTYSFQDLLPYPVAIKVFNKNIGIELIPNVDYTVDWPTQTITVNNNVATGQTIQLTAYGLGGGNQMYNNSYNGADVGNTIIVPIAYNLITEFVIFVNGVIVNNYTTNAFDTASTRILFSAAWTSTDFIVVIAFGAGGTDTWSTAVTEYFVSAGELVYVLSNSTSGTNPANAVVEKNGQRARPPQGVEYIADGSSLQYYLPENGGYSQSLISDNDVSVYLDNQPLILSVDFVVDPYIGTPRTITLADLPDVGSQILISVRTNAQYYISGNTLTWQPTGGLLPGPGDVISVTTWNNTSQQNILTQVFVGPTSQGQQISEPYDSTLFDEGNVTGATGSFDFATGIVIQTNVFDTGRPITNTNRLMVSLNGFYLFENSGFSVEGTSIVLPGAPISAADVVAITSLTQSVIPGSIAFRIFQDMRGQQSTYRITTATTTTLSQALTATADIIYVVDASNLSEPNLPEGIFGLITINGERIAYRNRNTTTNTVSGLRRGTAGTGAADHAVDTPVYDIGIGNLLPLEYQDRYVVQNFLANGTTTLFTADEIIVTGVDSTELTEAVEVYVGGILQTSGYTVNSGEPVTIEFAQAPTSGYQVSIQVRRGLSWYEPGPSTPSNGVALQETDTLAARFIRGD